MPSTWSSSQVAGKDHEAVRRLDDDAHRVGDGVRHRRKSARAESPTLHGVVVLDLVDVERFEVGEFFLALAYHHRGEPARVNRRVADAVDDVGDAADVVEVAVRDEHRRGSFRGGPRDIWCWAKCSRCPACRPR